MHPLWKMHFKYISKCQKIWHRNFGCISGYSMSVKKVSRKKDIFCGLYKKKVSLKLILDHRKLSFLHRSQKILFFHEILWASIECPYVHLNFFFDILKCDLFLLNWNVIFGQWVYLHLWAKVDFPKVTDICRVRLIETHRWTQVVVDPIMGKTLSVED